MDNAILHTAKEAQKKQNYELSVGCWRELTKSYPGNPRYSLSLAFDLRAAGRLGEAGIVFRNAIRMYPEDFSLLYHATLTSFLDGEIAEADVLARQLVALFDNEPRIFALIAEIAFAKGDLEIAHRYFGKAIQASPTDQKLADRTALTSAYRKVVSSFPKPPPHVEDFQGTANYDVVFINMDHNTERKDDLTRSFQDWIGDIRRVPGVRGSYIPDIAIKSLTKGIGKPSKGTLGCALSHVAAWEEMLARDSQFCLILEDDAAPVVRLPSDVRCFGVPDGFDICFVNEKSSLRSNRQRLESVERFEAIPLLEAVATWPGQLRCPGADGYLLSKSGARRLLDLFRKDGFFGDLDWRLYGYGLGPSTRDLLPPDSVVQTIARQQWKHHSGEILAYSLFPPIIKTAGRSVRDRENGVVR